MGKVCIKCDIEKLLSDFPIEKNHIRNECSACKSLRYKKYCLVNSTDLKLKKKEYRKAHPEKTKDYLKRNKEQIRQAKNKRRNERMKSDPFFRFNHLFKIKLRRAFDKIGSSKNNRKTEEILGCPIKMFFKHIESQWSLPHNLDENGKVWMSWNNRGLYNGTPNHGWDLDHIKPQSTATSEKELLELNNHTNFQPLCSYINRDIKKNNLDWIR